MQRTNIQISVHFSPSLVQNQSTSQFEMTFPQEIAVNELLLALSEKYSRENPEVFSNCLIAINDECVLDHDIQVHNGDTVFLVGPISGG